MATSAVKFVFSATDNTSSASKSAQRNLRSIGEEAAKAAAGILSIEKARIGLQALQSVARVTSDAFSLMARNSAAMKGELGAAATAWGKTAGAMGDTIANTKTFKALMDTTIGAMQDFESWIESNSKTIEDVFAGAVRYSAQATRALLFTVKGLIDLIALAKNLAPAAHEQATSRFEEALWYSRYLGLKAREALTGESTKGRQREALWMMNRAVGDVRGNMGRALDQAESEITRVNSAFDAVDELLAKTAAAAGKGGDRATRFGGGGKSPKLQAQDEENKAYLAAQAQFARDMEEMRMGDAAIVEGDEAARYRAQLAAQAEYLKESERLDAEHRAWVHEEIARQTAEQEALLFELGSFASEMSDVMKGAYTQLADGLGQSIRAVVTGQESFGAAMQKMAADVAFGVATQATVKAAYETAEAIAMLAGVYTAPLAAGHFAAAAKYAAVAVLGFGAGAGLSAGGGGGGGGGAAASSSTPYTGSQRVATTEASAAPIVYEIHQYFNGVYTSEAQAGRRIVDAISTSQRSGTSASLHRGRL